MAEGEERMSRRVTPTLPWFLWWISALLLALALAFTVLNRDTEIGTSFDLLFEGIFGLCFLAFPTVGAVVASRRPHNPIGWIFLGAGIPFGLSGFAHGYAVYGLFTEPGSLPGAEAMAWLASWFFIPPLFAAPAFLFLLFPQGRAVSPRWRAVGWMAAVGIVCTILFAFAPGPLEEPPFDEVVNPFGIEGAEATLNLVATVGWASILLSVLAAAASMLVRLRRARGRERQQLKWVTSAAGLFALANVVGSTTLSSQREEIGQLVVLFAYAGIPMAAGVAILRHRLYDIDRILNRALVYGALTALLAGAYFGIVVAFQNAIPAAGDSDLTIAGSTLAVAALFRPLRGRVQGFIDRRFYRRRYDAQRTLEQFTARLRDEIDLEALNRELVAVVSDTMQPAHVSLWLRPSGGASL
jgi:hypothetical protein